jgi:predicted methyltransferase MtxX (methanogen marker protein 4)
MRRQGDLRWGQVLMNSRMRPRTMKPGSALMNSLALTVIELSVRADVSRADMVLAYLVKQAGMSLLSRASQVSSTAETRLPSG